MGTYRMIHNSVGPRARMKSQEQYLNKMASEESKVFWAWNKMGKRNTDRQ